jgi:hypothetical protein
MCDVVCICYVLLWVNIWCYTWKFISSTSNLGYQETVSEQHFSLNCGVCWNFSWDETFDRDLKIYKETGDVGEVWYDCQLILVFIDTTFIFPSLLNLESSIYSNALVVRIVSSL